MSLTKTDWMQLWLSVKEIERNARNLDLNHDRLRRINILSEVTRIKQLIEQHNGPME